MKGMRRVGAAWARIPLALLLIAGLSLGGCFPAVRVDDAGDESFVRQAVPVLLGRKVRGFDELAVLTDLIGETNRETLVRTLMEEDEFLEYWTEILIDDLRVQREGAKRDPGCFGDPALAGDPDSALAAFVLTNPPSADFGTGFRMTDLVRSAILLDNLFPVYRGHVFALANKPNFGLFSEQAKRTDLGASFEHIFLNRQLGCMLCHNTEFSLSGEGSGWDRTHPIPGEVEEALYGSSAGTSQEQAYAVYRTDVRGGTGAFAPWGSTGCGTFKPSVGTDPEAVTAWFGGPLGRRATVKNVAEILHFGYLQLDANGLDRSLDITTQEQCEFCQTSCAGVDVAEDAPGSAVNAAAVKAILLGSCSSGTCHGEGSGGGDSLTFFSGTDWYDDLVNEAAVTLAGQTRVIPGNSTDSYLVKKIDWTAVDPPAGIGGSAMPLGGGPLLPAQIETIANWIDDIPSGAACNVCDTLECNPLFPPRVTGHEAAAFLLATRIVDNVWNQVMGYPLTIANYFPRNEGQKAILWNLTEYQFIPNDWSLKELLVRILTTDLFNRKAPELSTGTTAYELPMAYDPWVEADPREPPVSDPSYDPAANPRVHHNAMSDGVYRYTARNLLASVHQALGWPAPERLFSTGFGSTYPDDYPNAVLQKALGQFFSDAQAESKNADFPGLLGWESVHGICEKPTGVASDWIDSVVTAAGAFAGPGGALTLEDLLVLMRDWMLGDGTIGSSPPAGLSDSEADELTAYLGVPLSTEAGSVADLEDKLRGVCGVLLQTPQFWLAGIAPPGIGPEPRMRVCTAGPCTYQEICEALEPTVETLITGTSDLTCSDDSLDLGLSAGFPEELCLPEVCGRIAMDPDHLDRCVANPLLCPREPPVCDPRCARIDCCGGPLPPIDRSGYLIAWADGARVGKTEGVRILRPGSHRWEGLEPDETLRQGDLLAIRPGSHLDIRTRGGRIRTPRGGLSKKDPVGTRLLMVTGKRALAKRPPDQRIPKLDLEAIYRDRQLGPWRWGEAGRPLRDEERRGFKGFEEERGKDFPTVPRPKSSGARKTTQDKS